MYNVAALMRIYVDDPSALEEVREKVEGIAKVQSWREEDVGFGIKVLKLTVLFDDAKGGIDELERKIKKLEHVSQVEVEGVSRV